MIKKYLPFIPFYAIIFITSLLVYTHNNDFPYFYHTTEPTKIAQITDHKYNFNHPLLMLNTVEMAVAVSSAETDQDKVQVGRMVSAVYASLTVILLVICVQIIAGFPAAMISGIFLILSPKMIVLSHFFKEDPTFLFGIALSFLMFILLFRKPTYRTLLFAAAACAIASSGKYVGLIMLPVGIFICAVIEVTNGEAEKISMKRRIVSFVSVFLAVLMVINIQVLFSIPQIIDRLFPLVSKTAAKSGAGIVAFTGHGGVQVSHPLTKYGVIFMNQTTLLIPLLALGYMIFFFIRYRTRTGGEKMMMAFFFLFTLVLSFGKVASSNYFLPQEMITHIFAALAIVNLTKYLSEFHGMRVAAVVGVIILSLTIASAYPYARNSMKQHSLNGDTRIKLVNWLESNQKEKMVIASDMYALLPKMIERSPVLSSRKSLTVYQMEYTGDLATIDGARKMGITHIVICGSTYRRFFNEDNSAGVGSGNLYDTRKQFYSEVMLRGKKVWEEAGPGNGVINEAITLYDIRRKALKED